MNTSDGVLQSLKEKLATIVDVMDRRKRIIYIDYPLHRNIGDLLINMGTEEFFKSYGYTVKRRYNLYDLPEVIPDVDDDDIFVFHGGGNLGDLYPEHLDAVSSVLERFPNHQVVQFPQTVFFSDDHQRELRCNMLKRHPQMSVFVRDTRSLAALQDLGVPNVYLMPDMAHQLYGELSPDPAIPVDKQLYFFRTDVEGGTIPAGIMQHHDQSVDWDKCINLPDRLACAFFIRAIRFTKLLGRPVDVHRGWYESRDNMIQSAIELLSKPQVIYTNRLHTMLLGTLIGREVHWFDNTYGKLSSYVDTWLQDIKTIRQMS